MFGGFEGFAPARRSPVYATQRLTITLLPRAEIPLRFKAVQQGIKGAWADVITVAGQFFDHAQPEDGLFDCVVKNVKAYQAGIEVAIGSLHLIEFRFRHSIY